MIWKILLTVLLILIIATFIICRFFFRFAVVADNGKWDQPPAKEPDPETPKGRAYYERKRKKQEAEEIPYEDAWIVSKDGLKLHARYYPNEKAERIVILCHGYHGSVAADFAFILPMLKRDCEILAIDERAHGESEGKHITFGAKEKQDIHDWADYMAQKNTRGLPVYLFGVSMGAASVLMNADTDPAGVKGIIADCGYTNMHDIICDVQKAWYKLPAFPGVNMMAFNCRLSAGFSMKDADARSAVKRAKLPVLFIHGTSDHFVPVHHTEQNAAACVSRHRIVYVEDASHAASAQKDPVLYEREVRSFFSQTEADL